MNLKGAFDNMAKRPICELLEELRNYDNRIEEMKKDRVSLIAEVKERMYPPAGQVVRRTFLLFDHSVFCPITVSRSDPLSYSFIDIDEIGSSSVFAKQSLT